MRELEKKFSGKHVVFIAQVILLDIGVTWIDKFISIQNVLYDSIKLYQSLTGLLMKPYHTIAFFAEENSAETDAQVSSKEQAKETKEQNADGGARLHAGRPGVSG